VHCRHTCDQRIVWYVLGDDSTRGHDRTATNGYTAKTQRTRSNPGSVAHHDRRSGPRSGSSQWAADQVASSDEFDTMSDITPRADTNRSVEVRIDYHTWAEPGALPDLDQPSAVDPTSAADTRIVADPHTGQSQHPASKGKKPRRRQ
jgi:hypothetical protein